MSLNKLLTNTSFATILLFLMNMQYKPIEGTGVSVLKVGAMILCPFIFIWKVPYITRPLLLTLLYMVVTFICANLHPDTFRASTLVYLHAFFFMYATFYNLIYNGAFSLGYFIEILKILLIAYIVFFILQQAFLLLGIRRFFLINLMGEAYLHLFKTNSLALEPSHTARILIVVFYALLKSTEFKYGHRLSFKELYTEYRWTIIGFLYTMVAMGSGTAILALIILSCYFVNRKYILYAILVGGSMFLILKNIDYQPINRVVNTVAIVPTMDKEKLAEVDGSAFTRINPIMNTFLYLDLSTFEGWFGHGIDYSLNGGKWYVGNKSMVGGIADYGFLSFIIMQLLICSCCFRTLFSIDVAFYILLIGFSVGNIFYGWGMVMMFTVVKYFSNNH